MIFSNLLLHLSKGVFTITGEIEPLKTTSINEIIKTALTLNGHVTAVNITDNPQAFAYMSGLYPAHLIQREIGMEAIYQLTCRDKNRLGLFSDILAASAAGIRNILALTGDHTTLGDNPNAKPVFVLLLINFIPGYPDFMKSGEPSEEPLSTIIISIFPAG